MKIGPLLDRLSAPFDPAERRLPPVAGLGDTRRPLLIGAVIIVVTFFGIGLWAATAPLDSAAIAPGFITVESNRRTIQHLEGGIVREILVQDGDRVKAGEVLLRLDDTRARAQMGILRADLDSQLAIEARLVAERDGLPAPRFSAELTERLDDPTVAAIVESQRALFAARGVALAGQRSILEQRIIQFGQQVDGLKALEASKAAQIKLIRDELKDLYGLLEQGYVTRPRVLALEREASRLEGERGDHVAAIARARQGAGEAQLQIYQLEKGRQEEVARELRDVRARITELRERIVAAADVLQRIDIVAPVSGTVMDLAIHTAGGVVAPGASIMDIVPANDALVVEVHINPIDIDTVHPGQAVALRINTADARLTPVINGRLATVSADRVVEERTNQTYYRGRVVIPPEELRRLEGLNLHSGMMVEALINRGEQTALHYALKPLTDALARSFREK
ncbi:MAG: HlyD family type I secretion periplasmic adaptor subunit [Rhodospirillales bacterium]|nr:HlyD family type I secretion periplasmic adaptor subunit [Rhodospirillales bacterium]